MQPIVYVAMPAILALVGLGAHAAYASCIAPTGSQETAAGPVRFSLGGATVNCTTTVKFTPPASAASCTPPDPICVNADSVVFSGCSGSIFGFNFNASLSVPPGCTWQVCISGNGATASLKIPQNCLKANATIGGSQCTTTAPTGGPATITGTFNNTSSFATFPSQSVPVTTSGGFPCPSATSANFQSTGNINITPAVSVH